jgi:RES domain-containing protein
MVAHPEYQNLIRRVCACRDLGHPWKGHVYRCPKLKFSKKTDVLSGKGSLLYGGRWNSAGQFPSIYASLTPQTALEECFESTRYYGLLGHTSFPRSMIAMNAKLHDVLNLSDGTIRKHLFVSKDRLMEEDWRKARRSSCPAPCPRERPGDLPGTAASLHPGRWLTRLRGLPGFQPWL